MTLVAATPELVTADLAGRQAFSEAIGADVPENWPPELYENTAMKWSLRQLAGPGGARLVDLVPAVEEARPHPR